MSSDSKPKIFSHYQLYELIGQGANGVVSKGVDMLNGDTVAIKQIFLENVNSEKLSIFENEISVLQKLKHPNIVQYKDYFSTKKYMNIVLEYVEGGSLQSLIKQKNITVTEDLLNKYIKQVLEGLDYIHSQGIVHRDIKAANLLYTKDAVVKLADFGFAYILNDDEKTNSLVGSPFWMPPEIIQQTGKVLPACDIWSLACTMIELLTGKPPYGEYIQMHAFFRIIQDDHPTLPENISEPLKNFLLLCFNKNPNKRPSAQELLNHPWIKNSKRNNAKEKGLSSMSVGGEKALKELHKKEFYSNSLKSNEKIKLDDENNNGEDEYYALENKNKLKENSRSNSNNQNEVQILSQFATTKESNSNFLIGSRRNSDDRQNNVIILDANNKSDNTSVNFDIDKLDIASGTTGNGVEDKTDRDGRNDKFIKKIPGYNVNLNLTAKSQKPVLINYFEIDKKQFHSEHKGISNVGQQTPTLNKNITLNEYEESTPNKKSHFSNKKLGNMKNVFSLAANSNTRNNSSNKERNQTTDKKYKTNQKDRESNLMSSNSFQNENFCYKSNTTICEVDLVLDYFNEITALINNLKETRKDSFQHYINDININYFNSEFYKRQKKKKDYPNENIKNHLEIKIAIDYLNESDIIIENDLICVFYNLITFMENSTSNNHNQSDMQFIYSYFKANICIVDFIHILTLDCLSNKVVFLYLFFLNKLLEEDPSILEDLVSFQLFFYLIRSVQFFSDWEIKAEVLLIIHQILTNNFYLISNFLSSGGFYLIPYFIDDKLNKSQDSIPLIAIDIIIQVLEVFHKKFDQISNMFIKNQLLKRLNIVILEMFQDDVYNENNLLFFERSIDLLIKLTCIQKMEKVCCDSIIGTILNVSHNFYESNQLIQLYPKILEMFEQLMQNNNSLNKLESLGYIEFLINLLKGLTDKDLAPVSNLNNNNNSVVDEDKIILVNDIIKVSLSHLKHMCLYSSGRCEQFAFLDGVKVILKIYSNTNPNFNNIHNTTILEIISELICATKTTRLSLKNIKSPSILNILFDFIKSNTKMLKESKEVFGKITFWLNADREFIEDYFCSNENFDPILKSIHDIYEENFFDLVEVFIKLFGSSKKITNKFYLSQFANNLLESLDNKSAENLDVFKINIILDILNITLEKTSYENLDQIKIIKIIENVETKAKDMNFITVMEKIKTINQKLLAFN